MKKNKLAKVVQAKKVPVLIVTGVLLAATAGGAYYLSTKQDKKFNSTTDTTTQTNTDAQIQNNVDQKAAAGTNVTTTTPTTATQPATASLTGASLSILRDGEQAPVYLYGPAGTYGVEKLSNGNWVTLKAQFSYSGRGGYNFDTISSSDSVTHYRVFLVENGTKAATSGDTAITWQQILDKGTLTVPLAG